MHRLFTAFRAFAALTLVLALVAGTFNIQGASAQDAALPGAGTVGVAVTGSVTFATPVSDATVGLFPDASCTFGTALVTGAATLGGAGSGLVTVSLTPDTAGDFFIGVSATAGPASADDLPGHHDRRCRG